MANTYKTLCTKVQDAIRAETKNVWKDVIAPMALEHFGTREAYDAARAQFATDAVLPAFNDEERRLLALDAPKKGSEAYIARVAKEAGYKDQHEADAKARAKVQRKRDKYLDRVAGYAWPQPEAPKDKTAAAKDEKARSPRVKGGLKLGEAQGIFQKLEALEPHDKIILAAIAAWQDAEAKRA